MQIMRIRPSPAFVFALLLGILLFILDASMLSLRLWARYLLPLAIVYFWGRRRELYPTCLFLSLLMLASLWLEAQRGPIAPLDVFANHLLPLLALWAFAWLTVQRRGSAEELEARVQARTAELVASEQRYRLLAENATDVVWAVDLDGGLTYVSPSVLWLFGVTRDEILGVDGRALLQSEFPPTLLQAVQAGLADLRAGRAPASGPVTALTRHRDGSPIWIETELGALYDDGARPIGMRAASRNVSAREAALGALRRSEERFATLFRSSPAGMLLGREADGRILEANDAFLQPLGYTRAEVVGRTGPELGLVTPAAAKQLMARLAAESHAHGLDMQLVAKDGSTVDVLYAIEYGDYNGEPCFLATAVDISARKQLEEQLRDSEERFRLIVQNLPDVVALYDEQGRLLYVSPAVATTHGVPAERMLGTDALLMEALATPPDTGPHAAELARIRALPQFANRCMAASAVAFCLQHPGIQQRVEITNTLPSGEVKYFDTTYQAYRRGDGRGRVVAVTHDITALTRMERELRRLNEELEQLVAERTAELEAAVADLTAALHLKSEFLAMISHELRTPLMGVLSMAELLEDAIAGPLNERQATYVRGIRHSGERLLAVINGILAYTQLSGGKLQLQAEPCNLAYLFGICSEAYRSRIHERHQVLVVAVDPPELTIQSDGALLADTLKRLLDNAVKFTPEGGEIGLAAHSDPVGDGVKIVVWDTGIGIAPDQLARIRQPFIQLDGSLARTHEGTGMGLAIVDKAVRSLGGTLQIESTPGQGSRFNVTLPARLPG